MQKANGREKQNSYRFKPKVRDVPLEPEKKKKEVQQQPKREEGGGGNNGVDSRRSEDNNGRRVFGGSARLYREQDNRLDGNRGKVDLDGGGGQQQEPMPCSSGQAFKERGRILDTQDNIEQDEGGWQTQKSRKKGESSRIGTYQGASLPDSRRLVANDQESVSPSSAAPRGNDVKQRSEIEETGAQARKNPAKKKKPSKEERLRKREEAALKELYKPKDSRITVLHADLFEKIKAEAAGMPAPPSESLRNFRFSNCVVNPPTQASVADFPTLNVPPKKETLGRHRSFVAASNIPLPLPSSSSGAYNLETATTPRGDAKINSPQPPPGSSLKKVKWAKRPITVNLEDLLQASKPVGVVNKQIAKKEKRDQLSKIRENPKVTVGNLLDSSGPTVMNRGKIRQKKKKPSKLKRAILESRHLRNSGYDSDFCATVNRLINESPNLPEDHLPGLDGSESAKKEINVAIGETIECSTSTSQPHPESPAEKEKFKALLDAAEANAKSKSAIPESVIKLVKLQMHTRKFRDYCDMFVTKELHGLVISLMQELYRLQDRIYKTDPIKLQYKRRYVNGIKEVLNSLKLKRVQLVILAPDIEPSNAEGGLNDKVSEIISLAKERGVPCIFSGNRFILGRCIKQLKSPVSAIAVLDKQSLEQEFNSLLEYAASLRNQYQEDFDRKVQEIMANGG